MTILQCLGEHPFECLVAVCIVELHRARCRLRVRPMDARVGDAGVALRLPPLQSPAICPQPPARHAAASTGRINRHITLRRRKRAEVPASLPAWMGTLRAAKPSHLCELVVVGIPFRMATCLPQKNRRCRKNGYAKLLSVEGWHGFCRKELPVTNHPPAWSLRGRPRRGPQTTARSMRSSPATGCRLVSPAFGYPCAVPSPDHSEDP